MSSDERRPARTPPEPARWEQRLRHALQWYGLVLLGSLLLAAGGLPNHLTAALQWLANLVVVAEFVVFLPAGFILLIEAMRRHPATRRSEAWGFRLLVTSWFGGSILVVYGFITGLLPHWHRSNIEGVVLTVLAALMFVLFGLGLALVVVAFFREGWHFILARVRRPPASLGV